MGYCLETAIGAVPTGNHAVEKQVKCRPQQTLCRSVSVVGTGYWSGVENHVELRPGVADSGIRFIREDLDGACVPVSLHNRIDAEKRTNLQCCIVPRGLFHQKCVQEVRILFHEHCTMRPHVQ